MAAVNVLGESDPSATGIVREVGDRESASVTVEGLYDDLENLTAAEIAAFAPTGFAVDTHSLASNGDGTGRLTLRCVKYESGTTWDAVRTTFRVDMAECQYDLEDHPHLEAVRDTCIKWLATDEAERVDGNSYKYRDGDELKTIFYAAALKFCAAYMAGIRTFNRYFPVVERVSTYKNPPGLTLSGRSFTGGSPMFSNTIGKYDTCPLTLNGYDAANWFKSKDTWEEQGDKTWNRVEQWTWTPAGSSSAHAWIYTNI